MIYRCKHCGNIVFHIKNSGINVVCCGEPMEELIPNTIEASLEKHIPVINQVDNKVQVTIGSMLHPMSEEHFIEWVLLKTENNIYINYLKPNEEPITNFTIDSKILEVYCYCNLHGLWKTK